MLQSSISSPYQEAILNRLQFQGNSNDCAPFTLATVINALLEMDVQAALLAREMDHPVWRGFQFIIRRIPHWATFPWGMVDVFRSFGLQSSWRMFTRVEDLWGHLSGKYVIIPFLGGWKPFWAHVMTLIAWDANLGWGFCNTQYPSRQIYWLTEANFRTQWQFSIRTVVEVKYT